MNIDNKNNNIENEKKGYPIQNIEKNEIIAQSNLIPKNTKIDNSSRNPGINFKEIDYFIWLSIFYKKKVYVFIINIWMLFLVQREIIQSLFDYYCFNLNFMSNKYYRL